MFLPPFTLPPAPASHPIHTLPLLLSAPPPFTYLFAPISTPLFASWTKHVLHDALGEGKYLCLSALEHPSEPSIHAALAVFLSPPSSSPPPPTKNPLLALTHALDSLPSDDQPQRVLLISRAERLAPPALSMLSRLGEDSEGRISVLLLSCAPWDTVRPLSALAPYSLYLPPLSLPEIETFLQSLFPARGSEAGIGPYHPALHPLFRTYTSQLLHVLSPSYTSCPLLLAQTALSRWPYFVAPVLKEWRARRQRASEVAEEAEEEEEEEGLPFRIDGDTLVKLIRHGLAKEWHLSITLGSTTPSPLPPSSDLPPLFTKTFPRPSAAADPSPNPFSRPSRSKSQHALSLLSLHPLPPLGELAKWVLVAAYIASANHPRTDARLFGRFTEAGRRRRRTVGSGSGGGRGGRGGKKGQPGSRQSKVPPRLLGPLPFPLERLTALLSVLLHEHAPSLLPSLSTASLHTTLAQLVERRIVVRVSAADKLDGVVLRCGEGEGERVRRVGREVGVRVEEFIWERA